MKAIHRSLLYFDWVNFGLTFLLTAIGLGLVFSATYTTAQPISLFFKKQVGGVMLGFFIYFLCSFIDYRNLLRWGYFSYFATIALLAFTLLKGHIGMGAQRWINLGFFKLQPSELAKPLLPAFIAYYLFTHKNEFEKWYAFIPILITLALSFILILKQPDLGTALIILFSGLIMLWLAGLSNKFFLYAGLILCITAPVLWYGLKPYQRNRIAVFMGQGTTNKERYHIEQATIAIGSGGLYGKGFLKGTQTRLQFLPESRTDFIFATLCEEWGFLGALLIIFLYILLFTRILFQIERITTPHIQLLAIGLIIPLLLSALINIGMVLGLLPIVGIPLPLVSYGLSNLCICCASLGWVQGIYMQHG